MRSIKAKKDKRLFKSKVFSVWQSKLVVNQNTFTSEYVSINEANESVMILPITKQTEVLLIEKYSPSLNSNILVLPGGKVEKGESLEITVKRELLEETGYVAKEIKNLAVFQILPGYLRGKTTAFLASNLTQKDYAPNDTNEVLKIKKIKLEKLIYLIKKGEIVDVRTIATILNYSIFVHFRV